MEIIYKKTNELSIEEITQICNVFTNVFEGHSKSITEFNNEFCNTSLGYSFHGLIIDDNKVVGAQSYIPFLYRVKNLTRLFALSVDTMIIQNYRNFDNIYDLWSLGRDYLKKEGVSFLFGFPNDNSYLLSVKGFGDKNIGDLTTYILPYKISAVKKELSYFDFISRLFCDLLILSSKLSLNNNVEIHNVHKDRETFDNFRYKWFDGNYSIVKESDFTFVYKITSYNGIQTSFLMDVYPMSKRNFDKAVRIMYKQSHKLFDIAIYVGNLNFKPLSMIKVPKKYEPKNFHFTGKILDKSQIDKDLIFDINNWDVNLSNYDLL